MPRRFGRLWRSGGRRAQATERKPAASEDRAEMKRRIEEARERLRQAIPPPEDARPESDRPQT